ncbi:Fe-S cluster assembly ATPase SufC [Thermosipho atlanticus]|uniref:Iron-regulated ABC transporter ATPase subunit SufC n=1 Tax=Thermosipho atlanticus DSM 15807 TaxID=1123380 RepID=A0A1M5SEB1_9BACT|nr:Fe-S cluster assembly ATPase SufC [Thermosipho atlanticus]SHH36856.1 Iron-regulated ABC transporter ATPase subunit SufC [Thermosipho atlanticus DSM 15807]
MSKLLQVNNLHAVLNENDTEILKGVNLEMDKDELHVIMGPNGSGKSTLANVIMGNSKYRVTSGDIIFEGESIKELSTDERAKKGIFMTFQNPFEIEGIKFSTFLITAYRKLHGDQESFAELNNILKDRVEKLAVSEDFLDRFLNFGFSGGEKKKSEILQAYFLKPKLLILDEIDSGLDVDALRIVAEQIKEIRKNGTSVLIITHYKRILNYLDVDKVHIYIDGKIVMTGGLELANEVEEKGYTIVKG